MNGDDGRPEVDGLQARSGPLWLHFELHVQPSDRGRPWRAWLCASERAEAPHRFDSPFELVRHLQGLATWLPHESKGSLR